MPAKKRAPASAPRDATGTSLPRRVAARQAVDRAIAEHQARGDYDPPTLRLPVQADYDRNRAVANAGLDPQGFYDPAGSALPAPPPPAAGLATAHLMIDDATRESLRGFDPNDPAIVEPPLTPEEEAEIARFLANPRLRGRAARKKK